MYSTYAFSTLQREWDTHRNEEDHDPEGGGAEETAFIEAIKSEIRARLDLLGDIYPFVLSPSGESLELKVNICDGGYIYLFCLLLSHPAQGAVFNGRYLPPITNMVRDYFQACATLAAAGEVTGNAYSFGFPRPDHTGFLGKLKQIYSLFGESVIVWDQIPLGASPSPKDEQIDVIAWEPKSDGAAGKHYLLGQVASGANWKDKTIKGGPIDSFHDLWFARKPASTPTPAMFVPICFGNLVDGTSKTAIDAHSYEFGHIFYRFRIPECAARGILLAQQHSDLTIERVDAVPNIRAWVDAQVTEIRGPLN
jgi:hypothetical protein